MANDYHHGVRVIEVNEGARAIRTVLNAVIGIVCTGDDTYANHFSLNTPTLITNVNFVIGKASSQGTLKPTLEAIANQCSPVIVAVLVEMGATDADTTKNIIGTIKNDGKYTSMPPCFQHKLNLKLNHIFRLSQITILYQ